VLLDWRGTLVVAPTYPSWVRSALELLGREASPDAVDQVLTRLRAAQHGAVDSSAIDTDPALHRKAYADWFGRAGLDRQLADTLYELESDPLREPFAEDVGPTLCALSGAGVAVGILSDIHVDIRPAFAAHIDPDGASWADYVDLWLLSFELGLAKPDPAVFELALDRLGLPAREVLMVGDRGAWDGAAAACDHDAGAAALAVSSGPAPASRS
jgi:FMN phosphatase YigB (HAD superfamily)